MVKKKKKKGTVISKKIFKKNKQATLVINTQIDLEKPKKMFFKY